MTDAFDKMINEIAKQEIERRLKQYDKLLVFTQEVANWAGPSDSWYGLFKDFQKRAKEALK